MIDQDLYRRCLETVAPKENVRCGLSRKPNYTKRLGATEARVSRGTQIFEYIKKHGPVLIRQVVKDLGIGQKQAYNAIPEARLACLRAGYVWHVRDIRIRRNGSTAREYWVEAQS